jgi:NAD(P)-dependent dehydrogenase (short-subunit alcohol dehydrogenase family)
MLAAMAKSSLQGTVAIVTGGGSGIGRALSLELAARGAFVHVTDVNGASAEATATQIGASAKHAALDVRDAAAVARFCESVGKVDYLFNNAGIPVGGEVQDISLALWDRIIDVNIRGVVHGIHAVYPGMIARGSGHIINTASLAGLIPTPLGTPYGMTKHAVVGLSVSLRMEAAAYGVRVSALCPGVIETPILDSKGPEDLPRPKWLPDNRKMLTRAAGEPYPVAKLASETLDAVARNVGVIVIPGRARMMWRGYRLAPAGGDAVAVKMLASARKSRPA